MVIRYYLKSQRRGAASGGDHRFQRTRGARSSQGASNAGINTVVWTMSAAGGEVEAPAAGEGGGGARTRRPIPSNQLAPLGDYTVTLQVGETKLTQPAKITKTQGWSLAPSPTIIRQ